MSTVCSQYSVPDSRHSYSSYSYSTHLLPFPVRPLKATLRSSVWACAPYPAGFISKLIYVYHKCVPKCVVILPPPHKQTHTLSAPRQNLQLSMLSKLLAWREQKHFKYSKKKALTTYKKNPCPHKTPEMGVASCTQLVGTCTGHRNSSNGCNR